MPWDPAESKGRLAKSVSRDPGGQGTVYKGRHRGDDKGLY